MQKILVMLALVVGCAEGATPVGDADLGSDTSTSTPDVGQNTPDTSEPEPDTNTGCGLCCPGEKSCLDGVTVRACLPDGSGFTNLPCVGEELCTAGVCAVPPLCEAGAKSCYDATTVLTCRQTQDGYTTTPCPDQTSCSDGMCLSGAAPGAACTADADCVTGNCHCDAAEGCPAGLQGYCATRTCTADSCGRDAVCFAASVAPLGNVAADYDHCVTKCTPGSCPTGQECLSVPIRTADGVGWDQACYFTGFADIGAECATDAECIGGKCLLDYFNTGYCTRECGTDGVCPADAACVQLIPGQYHCSLLCGDGSFTSTSPCPLDIPTDRFDVSCRNLPDLNNNTRRVCTD